MNAIDSQTNKGRVAMRRRDFISGFGGTVLAAAPVGALGQQSALPIIGFLGSSSEAQTLEQIAALRRGLADIGLVEGRDIAIEFRWAQGQYDRLPLFASDLVQRSVRVIIAQAPPAALAAKKATSQIPIVFVVGFDPVRAGLVDSLNRPGGNATGMTLFSGLLGQKRLELLRELVPGASAVAMLANLSSPDAAPEIGPTEAAAKNLGLEFAIFSASAPEEIAPAFAKITDKRPDAILIGTDSFLLARREAIVAQVSQLRIPAIYPFREFAVTGGLASYGANIPAIFRQAGIYAARIVKGDRPQDLPVMQPTVFEFVLNLKTAKSHGLNLSAMTQARADEVIE